MFHKNFKMTSMLVGLAKSAAMAGPSGHFCGNPNREFTTVISLASPKQLQRGR
jgi:hypothetical protein